MSDLSCQRSNSAPTLPLAVTMGDPAGIGPEIVARSFADLIADVRALVVGDVGRMRLGNEIVRTELRVREIAAVADARFEPGTIDVLGHDALPHELAFGVVDARAGRASFDYLQTAIREALAGRIAAIVTAPIHKEAWHAAGIEFPDHTEVLAAACGTDDVAMMLFNDELRIALVSIHVSLRDAIDLLTVERELRIIRLAHRGCLQMGIAKPRVAVAGLNPHAGESGIFGCEDRDVIAPAVALAQAESIDASGPWPGDTVFMQARMGRFDIVVAQYHDQGLIPVKYLGVDHGVNVTVGLPFVRTSVDHGTAFDIAGTGKASAASLRLAITHAAAMMRSAPGRDCSAL